MLGEQTGKVSEGAERGKQEGKLLLVNRYRCAGFCERRSPTRMVRRNIG
jgi:hypothetical protein